MDCRTQRRRRSPRPIQSEIRATTSFLLHVDISNVYVAPVRSQVAALSQVGQERRKKRKAAKYARERRKNAGSTPETDVCSGVDADAATSNGGGAGEEGVAGVQARQQGPREKGGLVFGDENSAGKTGAEGGDDAAAQEEKEEVAAASGEGVAGKGGEGAGGGQEEEQGEGGRAGEEQWYLMAGTWLSRWHAYVLSGAGEDLDFPTPTPGPITNGDLVDENGDAILGKVAGKHYR